MKNVMFGIFLLSVSLLTAQTELIATDDKVILKTAGSFRGEQFGYVTIDGLYTIYNGVKTLHTKADYNLANQNFTTSFVNNIKEMSCDVDGRIYVSTLDDHIIMLEAGKVFAGLPVKSSDFHHNYEGYVCTNLFFDNNWYVAELLEKPTDFDDMFASSTYPDIQSVLNMVKPDELSINEQELPVVTGENKRDLAYPLETKLIWQKANESYIPCEEIVDISSSRVNFIGISGVHYQIYTVCKSGEVWVWTRKRNINDDMKPKFTVAEWEKLDFSGITTGQVKELTHVDRNFIILSTNSAQNGIIIYNIQKKVACSIDLPGESPIQDFFFSPYESIAVVATEKNVYAIEIDADDCQQGISHTDDMGVFTVTIHPNPTKASFTVKLPEGASSIRELQISDITGRLAYKDIYEHSDTSITLDPDLKSGIYFLQIIHEDSHISTQKLIIH